MIPTNMIDLTGPAAPDEVVRLCVRRGDRGGCAWCCWRRWSCGLGPGLPTPLRLAVNLVALGAGYARTTGWRGRR